MKRQQYEMKKVFGPLAITIVTTGLRGGDAGHGGRMTFIISAGNWDIEICHVNDEMKEGLITARGDLEMCALADALEYMARKARAVVETGPMIEVELNRDA